MSIGEIWRGNAVILFALILLNLAVMSLGDAAWIAIGVAGLAFAAWMSFRQGTVAGHDACGVLDTVNTLRAEGGFGGDKADRRYAAQAWSVSTGVRGVLLSALIPYLASCIYILCTLLRIEPLILPTRIAAWLLSLPWWCVVLHWQPTFVELTPIAAAVLMITPFLLPLCHFAGYMQGPKLWARTEKAMKEGRRRAKARSRVVKKRSPKPRKPEV